MILRYVTSILALENFNQERTFCFDNFFFLHQLRGSYDSCPSFTFLALSFLLFSLFFSSVLFSVLFCSLCSIALNNLQMLNQPLQSRNKSQLVLVNNPFSVLLDPIG